MENNIKTRNLIQEANAALVSTQAAFVETSSNVIFPAGVPAKIARASMANTNLLSNSGDLFVGTGNTLTEQIDGTEYTWAEVSKINRSDLFVNGFNSTSTNSGLAANVGVMIDKCLHVSNVVISDEAANSIIMGVNANTQQSDSIIIGEKSSASTIDNIMAENAGGLAIGKQAKVVGNAIAIGPQSKAEEKSMIFYEPGLAIGKQAEAHGSIAIGRRAMSDSLYSIAIGSLAKATASNAIQLGSGINNQENSFQVGNTMLLTSSHKIPSSLYTNIDIQTVINNKRNGVAIGYGASLGTMETGIQLGEGMMDNNALLNVYNYNVLDTNGTIVRNRLPMLYKHRLQKNVTTGGTSSGSSFNSYICEWYSNKRGLPTTQFNVVGYIVRWNTQQTIPTGDSLVDFEFNNNILTVKYLGVGSVIETFIYDEIEGSFGVQEI